VARATRRTSRPPPASRHSRAPHVRAQGRPCSRARRRRRCRRARVAARPAPPSPAVAAPAPGAAAPAAAPDPAAAAPPPLSRLTQQLLSRRAWAMQLVPACARHLPPAGPLACSLALTKTGLLATHKRPRGVCACGVRIARGRALDRLRLYGLANRGGWQHKVQRAVFASRTAARLLACAHRGGNQCFLDRF
jgi:hypothetical protein